MKGANPDCPCGSGQRYGACCRPLHRGEPARDAEALMRSRFCAFAVGEVDYLWRTCATAHPDRSRPREQVIAELRAFARATRFARLRVLEHRGGEDGTSAQVLFHAELYQRGKECSFLEASDFVLEPEGWRYLSGRNRPLAASSPVLEGLDLDRARFED